MPKQFGLTANERLKSRKAIEELFAKRNSIKKFPLILVYQCFNQNENNTPAKIGVSVTKKKFKKAVDRNRIKRLIKESYRLSKHIISENCQKKNLLLHIFFIYTDSTIQSFDAIKTATENVLVELDKKILL